jgi:hypothetical protein
VQTWLPYPDFRRSAACLDPKRLGKQRVEAYQILRTLRGISKGWRNHPAVKMWRGYEPALAAYMNACIDEWVRRGYRNAMLKERVSRYRLPPWFGDPAVHASHRANLLRKAPEFYGRYGWTEDPAAPYVWPAQEQVE